MTKLVYNPQLTPEANLVELLKHSGIPSTRAADFTVANVVTTPEAIRSNQVTIGGKQYEGNTVLTLNVPADLRDKIVIDDNLSIAETQEFSFTKVPFRVNALYRVSGVNKGNDLLTTVGTDKNGVLVAALKEDETLDTRLSGLYADFVSSFPRGSVVGIGLDSRYVKLRRLVSGESAVSQNSAFGLTQLKFDTDGKLGYSGQVLNDKNEEVNAYVVSIKDMSNTGKSEGARVARLKMIKSSAFTTANATRVGADVQLIDISAYDDVNLNGYADTTDRRNILTRLVDSAYTPARKAIVTEFAKLTTAATTSEQKAHAVLSVSDVSASAFGLSGTNASGDRYTVRQFATGTEVMGDGLSSRILTDLVARNKLFNGFSNVVGQLRVGIVKEAIVDQMAEVEGYTTDFATKWNLFNADAPYATIHNAYVYGSGVNTNGNYVVNDDFFLFDLGRTPGTPDYELETIKDVVKAGVERIANFASGQSKVQITLEQDTHPTVPEGADTDNDIFKTFVVKVTPIASSNPTTHDSNIKFAELFKDFRVTARYRIGPRPIPTEAVRLSRQLEGFVEENAPAA